MKLFNRKARDEPKNTLNGSGYSFLFGPTVAGKAVNERSAMQMSAVYACVRILSEAIASLVSEEELSPEYILPKAFDPRIAPAVAKKVAEAARKSGVARI